MTEETMNLRRNYKQYTIIIFLYKQNMLIWTMIVCSF